MYYSNKKQIRAFTLVEMVVVASIIVIMMAVALPNIPEILRQQRMSAAKNLIKTALAQAQAYASRQQKYAGIRFQKAANGRHYLVLIEHAPDYYYFVSPGVKQKCITPGRYTVIENAKPAVLPTGVGLISNMIDSADFFAGGPGSSEYENEDNFLADFNPTVGNNLWCIENVQTFCILFSPTGQMVVKVDVTVEPRRNYLGEIVDLTFGPAKLTKTVPPNRLLSYDNFKVPDYSVVKPFLWKDTLSNSDVTDDAEPWLSPERSASGFYLCYEKDMGEDNKSYEEFFARPKSNNSIERLMVNIYSGGLIDADEELSFSETGY